MRSLNPITNCMLVLVALAGFNGCNNASAPVPEVDSHAAELAHEHAGEEEHADEGLHGGHIVELGEEEYHAEITHDDATHKVEVYLLDAAVKNSVAIENTTITFNCVLNNQPAQFALAAVPQLGDPAGQSSHFELVSEQLCEGMDSPASRARLNVTISGKPYVGEVETHEHDHTHE